MGLFSTLSFEPGYFQQLFLIPLDDIFPYRGKKAVFTNLPQQDLAM
jgi:hypothetical protein